MEIVDIKEFYGSDPDVAVSVYRIIDAEAGVVVYLSESGMCCIPIGQTGLWSKAVDGNRKFYPVKENE